MRALLVGINKYPGSPLNGCVNDIMNTREILMSQYGMTSNDIRVLVDERATRKNILNRLQWLLSEQMVHNRLLLWYSGHGAYIPNRDPLKDYEYTGNDQLICPVDFDWDGTYILDDEFHTIVSKKRPECQLTAVMDCCHSGTFYRAQHLNQDVFSYRRTKSILPPVDILARDNHFHGGEYKPILKPKKPTIPGFKMISGCKDTQTSSDAYLDGEYCGALSWAMQKVWRENNNIDVASLHQSACGLLVENGFDQEPQLNAGPKTDMARLF